MVRASASEMAQISKRLGFASFWTSAVIFEGLALAQLGDVPEGIAQTRKAIEERLGTGTSCQHSHILGSLAGAYLAAGQPVTALEVLDEALSFVERTGERYFEAELYRLKASVQRALGDEAAAEASLQVAIEVAVRQSARMWELRAAMDLNRLWRSQGRDAEARAVLAPVYGSFTEGFENPDLKAAAALLA